MTQITPTNNWTYNHNNHQQVNPSLQGHEQYLNQIQNPEQLPPHLHYHPSPQHILPEYSNYNFIPNYHHNHHPQHHHSFNQHQFLHQSAHHFNSPHHHHQHPSMGLQISSHYQHPSMNISISPPQNQFQSRHPTISPQHAEISVNRPNHDILESLEPRHRILQEACLSSPNRITSSNGSSIVDTSMEQQPVVSMNGNRMPHPSAQGDFEWMRPQRYNSEPQPGTNFFL